MVRSRGRYSHDIVCILHLCISFNQRTQKHTAPERYCLHTAWLSSATFQQDRCSNVMKKINGTETKTVQGWKERKQGRCTKWIHVWCMMVDTLQCFFLGVFFSTRECQSLGTWDFFYRCSTMVPKPEIRFCPVDGKYTQACYVEEETFQSILL